MYFSLREGFDQTISSRGVFTTLPNIYDGAFLQK